MVHIYIAGAAEAPASALVSAVSIGKGAGAPPHTKFAPASFGLPLTLPVCADSIGEPISNALTRPQRTAQCMKLAASKLMSASAKTMSCLHRRSQRSH